MDKNINPSDAPNFPGPFHKISLCLAGPGLSAARRLSALEAGSVTGLSEAVADAVERRLKDVVRAPLASPALRPGEPSDEELSAERNAVARCEAHVPVVAIFLVLGGPLQPHRPQGRRRQAMRAPTHPSHWCICAKRPQVAGPPPGDPGIDEPFHGQIQRSVSYSFCLA